jgi:hypothetical protein
MGGVGDGKVMSGLWCFFACGAWWVAFCQWALLDFLLVWVRLLFGCLLAALAFPCILIGLLGSPLCGAALTFFAAVQRK